LLHFCLLIFSSQLPNSLGGESVSGFRRIGPQEMPIPVHGDLTIGAAITDRSAELRGQLVGPCHLLLRIHLDFRPHHLAHHLFVLVEIGLASIASLHGHPLG
jgi:hypothetical protein